MKISWELAPIAHRGLHDADRGIVENSPAAVGAALASNFGIEVDLQISRDGVPMVFHDFTLERLVNEAGPVRGRTARELTALRYRSGSDTIMTLDDLLDTVDGRVPLYLELKSNWSGDMALAHAVAPGVNVYNGPLALMSFDPRMMRVARTACPGIPCGLVSGAYTNRAWDPGAGNAFSRFALRHMLTAGIARPSFINYDISVISAWAPRLARRLGFPVLTWTVRTPHDRKMAARWADAMVFEGFVPTDTERGRLV
ncbi:MAG: glycerophosphodiester phosphodiesterase family protein [Hyphomicrobiaceae bacterium]